MARTQFKVTFTNAQPGAPVSVLTPSVEHIYSTATAVQPVGGKQLYLDATNAITVWSDAQDVIAQTVDGAGLFIQGTATVASPTVIVGDGTAPTNPAGSTASSALTDRGAWVTAHAYVLNDLVTQSGSKYVCAIAHTSGTFATDLAANDWALVGGAAAIPAYTAVSSPISVGNQKTPAQLTFSAVNQQRMIDFGWAEVPAPLRVTEDTFNESQFTNRYGISTVSGSAATETYTQNGKLSLGGAVMEKQYRSNAKLIAPHAVVAVKVEPGSTGGVSVGLFKDTTHFVRCYWSLDSGFIGGAQSGMSAGGGAQQSASAFLPAPTTSTGPIWFGCTLANQYAVPVWSYDGHLWYMYGIGSGTYAAPGAGDNLTTAATMAAYHPGFHLSPTSAGSTTTISGFRVWYPGAHGARDWKPITWRDGTPYTRDGKYFLTGTFAHGGASFYSGSQGVFSYDPASNRLSLVSRLFYNLTGTGLNAGYGGQAVYDDSAGQWVVLGNSWGFDDGTNSGIDEILATTKRDITRPGVYVLNATRVSGLGSGSYYDGALYYDSASAKWRMVCTATNARTAWTVRNPARYDSPDLTTWTSVATDATETGAEGFNWVQIGNTRYIISGNTAGFKTWATDLTGGAAQTTWTSSMPASLGFGGFPAHPAVIPVNQDDGTTVYKMVTFDASEEEGGGARNSLGGPVIGQASPIVTGWEMDQRKPTGF